MDENANSQTKLRNRRLLMVVYPGVHSLDVFGPLEILSATALYAPGDVPPYDLSIVASEAGPVKASSGLTITADCSFQQILSRGLDIDTLMIAGGHGAVAQLAQTELMTFVKAMAPKAKRIVSICTGALILAKLGLLDGKRASTHWFWCPIMQSEYPKITVDSDAIFVRDGNVWTSAGVTSGMDLALALIAMDWGHDIALKVARFSVMYMMRPGGQSQFSTQLVAQRSEDPAINEVLQYVRQTPEASLNVTNLAARAMMSERTFARRFKEELGLTPAAYVEKSRIEAAQVQLETTDRPIEQIALLCGFQSAERMRRSFHRHLRVSASEYRERFRMDIDNPPGPSSGLV